MGTQEVAIAGGFGKPLALSMQNGLLFGRVSSVTMLLPLAKVGHNDALQVALGASKQAQCCSFQLTKL